MSKMNEYKFDMDGEQWANVVGYEGIYMISNKGRIRALPKIVVRGTAPQLTKDWILSPCNSKGYRLIGLNKGGVKIMKSVHIIVAESFVPNPDKKPFINHKNGVKDDNRSENLEWVTQLENVRHAFSTKKIKRYNGSENKASKLTESDVMYIKSNYKRNVIGFGTLAKLFKVTPMAIKCIIRGVTWGHI